MPVVTRMAKLKKLAGLIFPLTPETAICTTEVIGSFSVASAHNVIYFTNVLYYFLAYMEISPCLPERMFFICEFTLLTHLPVGLQYILPICAVVTRPRALYFASILPRCSTHASLDAYTRCPLTPHNSGEIIPILSRI